MASGLSCGKLCLYELAAFEKDEIIGNILGLVKGKMMGIVFEN